VLFRHDYPLSCCRTIAGVGLKWKSPALAGLQVIAELHAQQKPHWAALRSILKSAVGGHQSTDLKVASS
jgi:hypothetical protein